VNTTPRPPFVSSLIAAATLSLCATAATAQLTPLVLELDGTRIPLGQTAEFVVRTTEARPLAAAGFSFEVRDRRGDFAVAFAALDSYELLTGGASATIDATFDPVTQRLDVLATSPDGTLNDDLGPLAVFRFSLDPAVATGDRFEIWMHPDTTLVDPLGEVVASAVGRADFRIVDDEPGQSLGALGGEIYPGSQVVIGATTERPFAIGSGVVELSYDATLFEPAFEVRIDPRYGSATIDSIDNPAAGQLTITFTSPDQDLNLGLHGPFVTVILQALPETPVGTLSAIVLGAGTALFDDAGTAIELEIDGEELEFVDPDLLVEAGFENGDLGEWWTAVGW
jgi:hypothetical protein